jgi:hypothetical protein
MRKPQITAGHELESTEFTLDILDHAHEKAELLEEIRQLRAAVAIYRRIAEQAMANGFAGQRTDAA